jgi:hypothetical protein
LLLLLILQFCLVDVPIPTPLTIINLLKEYWWIIVIGALVIVGVVSVFGVTIRRQSNDPANTPLLQSGNLLKNIQISLQSF